MPLNHAKRQTTVEAVTAHVACVLLQPPIMSVSVRQDQKSGRIAAAPIGVVATMNPRRPAHGMGRVPHRTAGAVMCLTHGHNQATLTRAVSPAASRRSMHSTWSMGTISVDLQSRGDAGRLQTITAPIQLASRNQPWTAGVRRFATIESGLRGSPRVSFTGVVAIVSHSGPPAAYSAPARRCCTRGQRHV